MELEFVTLEDNKMYIILDELVENNEKFVYLVDLHNKKRFVVRKEQEGNLVGLNDEKELERAMQLYIKRKMENYSE